MTKRTHGGRRPNQTGRPPKAEGHHVRKTVTLPPDIAAAIKEAQQPGESFSECIVRLCRQSLHIKQS
jgi:hypothetical protein